MLIMDLVPLRLSVMISVIGELVPSCLELSLVFHFFNNNVPPLPLKMANFLCFQYAKKTPQFLARSRSFFYTCKICKKGFRSRSRMERGNGFVLHATVLGQTVNLNGVLIHS